MHNRAITNDNTSVITTQSITYSGDSNDNDNTAYAIILIKVDSITDANDKAQSSAHTKLIKHATRNTTGITNSKVVVCMIMVRRIIIM